jgi:uncharacterized RDD family membrane protein YckC
MQWADEVRIETPEQIDVQLEVAGLGSRFVAQFLDFLCKIGLIVLLGLVLLLILALLNVSLSWRTMPAILIALGIVLGYAVWLGFDIYFETRRNGQTPGKRYVGIRVVKEWGGPVDFRSVCVRNLLSLGDLVPPLFVVDALIILLNQRGQRLGDMAAGTIVIRERSLGPPRDISDQVEHHASPEITFTGEQLQTCGGDDRYILRSFFERRRELSRRVSNELGCRLAATYCRKTGYPVEGPIHDHEWAVAFLASLYRDLRQWARHEG